MTISDPALRPFSGHRQRPRDQPYVINRALVAHRKTLHAALLPALSNKDGITLLQWLMTHIEEQALALDRYSTLGMGQDWRLPWPRYRG